MIYAKKRLGQHFLRSRRIVEKILAAAELKPDDVVLEVGPGTGTLTFELVEKVKRVIAVEKDRELAKRLQAELDRHGVENVSIVTGDILTLTPAQLLFERPRQGGRVEKPGRRVLDKLELYLSYKLIGNLPYYIASAVIRKFLENDPKPSLLVVMVQKEVGERIVAKPPNMSLLSVAVQVYGKVKIVTRVPKEAFWPKPKVDGVVLKITPFQKPLTASYTLKAKSFFEILKIAFAAPRKQLGGVFSRRFGRERARQALRVAEVSPHARPEEVSLPQWLRIAKSLSSLVK